MQPDDDERDAIDLITEAMYSVAFLRAANDALQDPELERLSVRAFYDSWFKSTARAEPTVPFSLGALLGYFYVGILFAKEGWFDLVPDLPLDQAPEEWGLSTCHVVTSKEQRPTLRYVIRRMRNALAHGRVTVDVPAAVTKANVLDVTTMSFLDSNVRDQGDTFLIAPSFAQLTRLVKAFQGAIHKHVRTKFGIQPPGREGGPA